jgi:hypothetical protein
MTEVYWIEDEELRAKALKRVEAIKELASARKVQVAKYQEQQFSDIEVLVVVYKEEHYFDITRYTIKKDGVVIADFFRNYSAYPQAFVQHSNGKRYFIAGFDYQGYTVVNLDDEVTNHYIPQEAGAGAGWCPTEWRDYDSETNEIIAEGCYWAFPFDCRRYDFSNPDVLPLPLLEEWPVEAEEEDDE